jgi:hypothetical protein
MHRTSTIALFVLASFFTIQRASAQDTRLSKVTIPFAFTVNDTALPAGKYVVSSLSVESPDTLVIASRDFHHPISVIVMTSPSGRVNRDHLTRLVFNTYGGRYFLREIVSRTNSTDAILSISRKEKKAVAEMAGSGGGQPVLVAIN